MLTMSSAARLSVPPDVLVSEVGDEIVLLSLETKHYYGLNEIGARMWLLLTEHGQVEPALRALLDEYDVSEEQLQRDMVKLIDDLVACRLMDIHEA